MQLKIEKLIYGGDGLARLPANEQGPGKSVFVPFVLDGETVEARLTEQKASFERAQLEQVIESAPARVQAACAYFQRCGGCQYQHANYQQQLAIKTAVLKETLRRTAKIELPCELHIHSSLGWNYRNRTRLKIQTAPEFALGYYRFRSHDLLPVEQCPISSPLANRALTELWVAGRAGQIPEFVREIELFANPEDDKLLLEIYCARGTSRSHARKFLESVAAVLPNAQGGAAFELSPDGQGAEPKQLAHVNERSLAYQTANATYQVSAGSFFQVNRFLIDELVNLVTSGFSGRLALDLYAGVGLFSVVLARSFAQVIAVEASQTSFGDLRHNCGQEVKAVRATTEKFLGQAFGLSPDFVVADPPRGGLGENVVRSLARLGAPRIAYVSCDPSTLARDLRTFVTLGYLIEGAHLVDLFPQTYHIESVFHLTR